MFSRKRNIQEARASANPKSQGLEAQSIMRRHIQLFLEFDGTVCSFKVNTFLTQWNSRLCGARNCLEASKTIFEFQEKLDAPQEDIWKLLNGV